MDLGTHIQQLRKDRGISQESLAEQVGVSRQAVSKWEQGLSLPSTENLLALARIFEVSADELTGLARKEEKEETLSHEPKSPKSRLQLLWLVPAAALFLAVGWYLPHPARPQEPAPPASQGPGPANPQMSAVPSAPERPDTGDIALLCLTDNRWEFLIPGAQSEEFPFGTSLRPTAMETVHDTDFRRWKVHHVACGALTLTYSAVSGEGSSLDSAATIVPGWETPRGIAVGSTESELIAQYGDELIYELKDSGWDILCHHDYKYAYATAYGDALTFYMETGQVAGIELCSGNDMGAEAWTVNNITRFPVKDGKPDFSLRQEPELEELDAARAVYVARHSLANDRNLSDEENYRCRLTLFGRLPEVDWLDYSAIKEDEESEAVMDLLRWVWDQETVSPQERSGLIPGLENLLGTEDLPYADDIKNLAQRILDEQLEARNEGSF